VGGLVNGRRKRAIKKKFVNPVRGSDGDSSSTDVLDKKKDNQKKREGGVRSVKKSITPFLALEVSDI